MAKRSYKIPDSLDKSVGDMEIAIRTDSGFGVHPVCVRILIGWLLSVLGCFFFVSRTFIRDGGFLLISLFIVLWLILTLLLLRPTSTGEVQAGWIVPMLSYLPKNMRTVSARRSSNLTDLRALLGLKDIHASTGLIEWDDGSVGFAFQVVGSASILLFEEDRDAILDRASAFFRKMKTEAELIFITAKQPQNVSAQKAGVAGTRQNLQVRHPDLLALCRAEEQVLENVSRGSFRTIHQYLLIKADSKEALLQARNILLGEIENSSLVFRQCSALVGDQIYEVFQKIYRGKESI